MASTARIDGSIPDPGDTSTRGMIFSGTWGVDYEFSGSPAMRENEPRRLRNRGFPSPYDNDLEGALRGRGIYANFLYLFRQGQYIRLNASTLIPDEPDAEAATAPAWGLPSNWTALDAIVPGRGIKIDHCYFIRGNEYVRYDWNTNSAGQPKQLAQEWHLEGGFDSGIDGIIAGQADLATKAFLFRRLAQVADEWGPISPEHLLVETPGFARFDFNSGTGQGAVRTPIDVSTRWGGLIQLLDAGPAIDLALAWCKAAIAALPPNPPSGLLTSAFATHFMTSSPFEDQLTRVRDRFIAVQARLEALPLMFRWERNLAVASQTEPGVMTAIGNLFSTYHGPNGRAAVMIHEAVHFTHAGGQHVDVPEWSGQTINGRSFGIAQPSAGVTTALAYHDMSVDQAIENPGSYSSFAQHIFYGQDNRFGGARPHE